MPKFYIHETTSCEVIFVREIEAADASAALDLDLDEGGDLIGVAVGDMKDSAPLWRDVHEAAPHNLPPCFYPEPGRPDAIAHLRAVLPYAESRAEDMEESDNRDVADNYVSAETMKAIAAVDAAKAFIAGIPSAAPPAPSDAPADPVKAEMLAALKRLAEIIRDRHRLHGEDIGYALASLKDAEAIIARAEGRA